MGIEVKKLVSEGERPPLACPVCKSTHVGTMEHYFYDHPVNRFEIGSTLRHEVCFDCGVMFLDINNPKEF